MILMRLTTKYFTAVLAATTCFGSASGQLTGLPPLDWVESAGKVRIKGIAMTHGEGMPFSLTWFLPNAWNPMDTLRAGQPVAISLFKTQTEYEKVCARGITLKISCFWECQLVLSKYDFYCLLNKADWGILSSGMTFTKNESFAGEGRKVKVANCLNTPYVPYALEPLSEGSDRRRNYRLRRELR
jgi:hypothetical protein